MSSSYQQVEWELDHGFLWIKMNNGRYWKLRRNGKTKTWKRELFRYRIPVKAGMYKYSEVTNQTDIGTYDSGHYIICSHLNPNN
jgi:hypothetical protein